MLRAADLFFTLLHLAIIGFNLFGWIWKPLRRAHLLCVLLTAASWFILGIWFGWGYCPITDWQWDIKRMRGERDLPNSFIKYFADRLTGLDVEPGLVDTFTGVTFGLVALFSLYLNFLSRRRLRDNE